MLFLYFFDLQEVIICHLVSVFDDPFTNFCGVDLLILLTHFGRILVLLLSQPLTLLHCDDLFMFTLRLYVCLIFFTLYCIQLALLTLNFSFKVGALFGLGLLDLSPVFSLFLYLFHHGDLLRLHFSNLLLHGLCFQLLLVECLRQPSLLSLLILQLL